MKRAKYTYPDDLEIWIQWLNDADDGALLKFWHYLPRAKTPFETKVIQKLTDELVSRNLK